MTVPRIADRASYSTNHLAFSASLLRISMSIARRFERSPLLFFGAEAPTKGSRVHGLYTKLDNWGLVDKGSLAVFGALVDFRYRRRFSLISLFNFRHRHTRRPLTELGSMTMGLGHQAERQPWGRVEIPMPTDWKRTTEIET